MQKTRKTLIGDFNYCSTTSYKKKNRFSVKHYQFFQQFEIDSNLTKQKLQIMRAA